MRILAPIVLLSSAFAAETQLPGDISALSAPERQTLLDSWRKNAAACPRSALIGQLKSPALKTRCTALDLLEDLTGNDFGFDPWISPKAVPAAVNQALQDWAKSDSAFLNTAQAPDENQIKRAIALFLTADEETRERTIRMLLPHKNDIIRAIEQTLRSRPDLGEEDIRSLRRAEYRMQLDQINSAKAAIISRQLVSDKRGDIIEGIEALRHTSAAALPVLYTLVNHPDPMVRETGIDVMLFCGKAAAMKTLMPMLQKETDPNILQIAFRRSVDYIDDDMKKLLMLHALSPQEDIAVTALNVLRDAKGNDDTFISSDEKKSKKAGPIRFSEEDFQKLLSSPNWRIRAALFELIASDKRNQTVPRLTPESRKLIYQGLTDDDTTVRQTAFGAIVSGKMFSNDLMPLCEELLKRDTEMIPQVIYLLMATNSEISETVKNMLARMTAEQIEQLLSLENDFTSYILASGSGNRATRNIVEALEKNPDPGVRRVLLLRKSKGLMIRTDGWDAFLAGLEDPAYTPQQKVELLESLDIRSLASLLATDDPNRTSSPSNSVPPASSARKQQFAPYMARLLETLKKIRDTSTSDDLRTSAMLTLIGLNDADSKAMLVQQFPSFTVSRKLDILNADDRRNILLPDELLTRTFQTGNEKIQKAVYRGLRSRRAERTLNQFISPEACSHELWSEDILDDWSSACRYSNATERFFFRPFLIAAVKSDKLPMHLREEIAFYCCMDETTRKKQEVQDFIAACTTTRAPFLQFANDAPKKRSDILPWATKWSKSPEPLIRYAVASCLQPIEEWKLVMPGVRNSTPIMVAPAILRRKLSNSSSRSSRVPEELLALVDGLQKDPDENVSMAAALSLFRLTGECNTAMVKTRIEQNNRIVEEWRSKEDREKATQQQNLASQLLSQFSSIVSNRKNADYSYGEAFSTNRKAPKDGLTENEKELYRFALSLSSDHLDLPSRLGEELDETLAPAQPGSDSSISFAALVDQQPGKPQTSDKPQENPATANESSPAPDTISPDTIEKAPSTAVGDIDTNAKIDIVFFEKPGCDECARTEEDLKRLKASFPNLNIETIVITTQSGLERNATLCRRFNVPGKERNIAPAVFSSQGYLTKARLNRESLRRLIEDDARLRPQNQEPQADKLAAATQDERQQAKQDIRRTYTDMTMGIVLLGGLIDGVNPCAFATLIFFLSYLRIAKRSPKELLWTGAAFISAVYLTYFSIGLAFNELIGVIHGAHVWKSILDWAFAGLALLAALLSFRDAWLARRGRMEDMSLKLPKFLRDRIHSVARTQAKARQFILAAFIAGILISVLELACTGQVYAPIIYQIQAGHESAIALLALYNLAFIAPLLLIFFLSYKGMSTQSLIRFQERHSFLVKILLGLLFLALSAVILLTSLS